MLLYEQRLYEIMRELIPRTFTSDDQAAMFHAAETWRLPFWDWAMKKPAWDPTNPDSPKNRGPNVGPNVPFLLTQKTVEVKTRTGAATAPNPMYKYILPTNKQHPERKTFKAYGIGDQQDQDGLKRVRVRRVSGDIASNFSISTLIAGQQVNTQALMTQRTPCTIQCG